MDIDRKKIIAKIRRKTIDVYNIPEEALWEVDIAKSMRMVGLRQISLIGYDVVSDVFFVDEKIRNKRGGYEKLIHKDFKNFDDYFDFLEGKIYRNACYYCLDLERKVYTKKIDTRKINKTKTHMIEDKLIETDNVKKYYSLLRNEFIIQQESVKKKIKYFFDFAYYIGYDFSGVDLLECPNLPSQKFRLDFNGALLTSQQKNKLGIKIQKKKIWGKDDGNIENDRVLVSNEEKTDMVLRQMRSSEFTLDERKQNFQIYYISDLHLDPKLKKHSCNTYEDARIYIRKKIQKMFEYVVFHTDRRFLLIGGDISHNYDIYNIFLEELNFVLNEMLLNFNVFVVLGNHELWDKSNLSFKEKITKYRRCTQKNNAILLQNEVYYSESDWVYPSNLEKISEKQLNKLSEKELKEKLKNARIVLFGGIGFSGYNKCFNAGCNPMIYRGTITGQQEMEETQKMEQLYLKLKKVARNNNTIVFSHMPIEHWCLDTKNMPGWVYVSGHTHMNRFHDDGVLRYYQDNQIGKSDKPMYLKSFLVRNDYDIFVEYTDGIYDITNEQYRLFYRGKNIRMNYNKTEMVKMLKKDNYYVFFAKLKNKQYAILNGGQARGIGSYDIQEIYNNIDDVIRDINEPLVKFNAYLKEIATFIHKIGGDGSIHGCIVDIDFFNHIFVNPLNGKITIYHASDMVNKIVYSGFEELIQEECPKLYQNYRKTLKDTDSSMALTKKIKRQNVAIICTDTDIYRASREIKKMQRLENSILCTWPIKKQRAQPKIEKTTVRIIPEKIKHGKSPL